MKKNFFQTLSMATGGAAFVIMILTPLVNTKDEPVNYVFPFMLVLVSLVAAVLANANREEK